MAKNMLKPKAAVAIVSGRTVLKKPLWRVFDVVAL